MQLNNEMILDYNHWFSLNESTKSIEGYIKTLLDKRIIGGDWEINDHVIKVDTVTIDKRVSFKYKFGKVKNFHYLLSIESKNFINFPDEVTNFECGNGINNFYGIETKVKDFYLYNVNGNVIGMENMKIDTIYLDSCELEDFSGFPSTLHTLVNGAPGISDYSYFFSLENLPKCDIYKFNHGIRAFMTMKSGSEDDGLFQYDVLKSFIFYYVVKRNSPSLKYILEESNLTANKKLYDDIEALNFLGKKFNPDNIDTQFFGEFLALYWDVLLESSYLKNNEFFDLFEHPRRLRNVQDSLCYMLSLNMILFLKKKLDIPEYAKKFLECVKKQCPNGLELAIKLILMTKSASPLSKMVKVMMTTYNFGL